MCFKKHIAMKNRFHILLLFMLIYAIGWCKGAPVRSATKTFYRGLEFYQAANMPLAMRYFTKSASLAEREGNYFLQVRSYAYISNIFYDAANYGRSLTYLTKCYKLASVQNDTYMLSHLPTNIVATCCKMGKPQDARRWLEVVKRTPFKDTLEWRYYVYYSEARIAKAEKHYTDALKFHGQALSSTPTLWHGDTLALYQRSEIAEIYLLTGKYNQCINMASECVGKARQWNDRDLLLSLYKILADAYAMQGDTIASHRYEESYLRLQDTVFNRVGMNVATGELADLEDHKNAKHVSVLKDIIHDRTVVIIAFSVLLLILLILLLLLIRNGRRLHFAYKAVVEKNAELLKTYDASLGEKATSNEKDGADGIDGELLSKIQHVLADKQTISNPDFSLKMLADEVESNTKYVSQVINAYYEMNFKTLLNECRIREACRLMGDSENVKKYTLQAIYENVGYSNATSFIRAFKRINGMTPSEYQRFLEHRSNQKEEDSDDEE